MLIRQCMRKDHHRILITVIRQLMERSVVIEQRKVRHSGGGMSH